MFAGFCSRTLLATCVATPAALGGVSLAILGIALADEYYRSGEVVKLLQTIPYPFTVNVPPAFHIPFGVPVWAFR